MGTGASFINKRKYTAVDESLLLPPERDFVLEVKIIEWPSIDKSPQFATPTGNFNLWDFDVWLLKPTDLPALCSLIMLQYNIPSKFDIKFGKWCGLFKQVQHNMSNPSNPYHNIVHLVDVLQTCAAFLGEFGASKLVNETDILALFLAALVHDIGHPGLSNAYQVHAETPLALRYNDISVLEHHHCALAFEMFQDSKSNIFLDVTPELRKSVRKSIINLVLSTDMMTHFTLYEELNDCVAHHFYPLATIGQMEAVVLPEKDRMIILRSLLHAADISNPAKIWSTSKKWSDLVVEEFFAQGDLEKLNQLPVSTNMDRNNSHQDEISLSFSDFIVAPFFLTLLKALPRLGKAVKNLDSNRRQWTTVMQNRLSTIPAARSDSEKEDFLGKLISLEDDFTARVESALVVAEKKLIDKLPILTN